MTPWDAIGWALFAALIILIIIVIAVIALVVWLGVGIIREGAEIDKEVAEQHETIRRQRGRFGLGPRD